MNGSIRKLEQVTKNHIVALLKRIWMNSELAKKPAEYLEYVVVHEMAHLLEATHNSRFVTLMDQFMPKWKFYRDELNRLPVCYEDWR